MKKSKIIASVLCGALLFATACGCAETSGNYWEVTTFTYEDGTMLESYVQLHFSPSGEYEVWANVSDLEADNSVIGVAVGASTTVNSKKNTLTVTNEMLNATEGWVRLFADVSSSYTYVDVYTKYAMHINEIIVCSEKDGEVFECSFLLAGTRVSQSSTSNRHTYTEEELAEMKNGPEKVCNEQNSGFDRAKVLAAFESATSASDSTSDS